MLGMKSADLARASKVSVGTIQRFETGKITPKPLILDALRAALEKSGIDFIGEDGVCLRTVDKG
jgi:transcriptional regulator with XRE-family HTH domain